MEKNEAVEELKKALNNLLALTKNESLSQEQLSLFFAFKATVQEKLKGGVFGKISVENRQDISAKVREVDNFMAKIRADQVTLSKEVKDFQTQIDELLEKFPNKAAELNAKAIQGKKKKKGSGKQEKTVDFIDALGSMKEDLQSITSALSMNIYYWKIYKQSLVVILESAENVLEGTELNAQAFKRFEDTFSQLDFSKKVKREMSLKESFDTTPIKDLLSTFPDTKSEDLQNKFKLSLILNQKKDKSAVPETYLSQFKDGYENLISDEDMVPISKEFGPPASSEIFPIHRSNAYNSIFSLDPETLCSIFHFSKDEYERLLAIKVLKQKEWRYTKQYQVWFKRASQVSEQTKDYEKGDYALFDWEKEMIIKTGKDLKIDYKSIVD